MLFRKPTEEQRIKIAAIDTVKIEKKDGRVEVKKVGRPKKAKEFKEEPIPIRLSQDFIRRIKIKANGTPWQTYAKEILAKHLDD